MTWNEHRSRYGGPFFNLVEALLPLAYSFVTSADQPMRIPRSEHARGKYIHKMTRARRRGPWKTSLVFTTRNTPGALFRSLAAFALRDLNLTKIESRPLRGKPWEYLFYLDFIGHIDDPVSQNAIGHLQEVADFWRVLGCYPQGD